jgi:hypothetical protein
MPTSPGSSDHHREKERVDIVLKINTELLFETAVLHSNRELLQRKIWERQQEKTKGQGAKSAGVSAELARLMQEDSLLRIDFAQYVIGVIVGCRLLHFMLGKVELANHHRLSFFFLLFF